VSFAPNQLIKQGAKLATCADDVIEELPTPIRAALLQAERPEAEQRNLLARRRTEWLGEKALRTAQRRGAGAH